MKQRILLVDDEAALRYSVCEYLRRVGYEVAAVPGGAEGLAALVNQPFDLIISDIMMDEMDGFEFQRRVRALAGRSIPFIFLTARGEVQDRVEGLRGGADDYISKPFGPEELEARVAALLQRVEQIREQTRRAEKELRARILRQAAARLRAPTQGLVNRLNSLLLGRYGSDLLGRESYLQRALEDASEIDALLDDLAQAAEEQAEEYPLRREPMRIAPIIRGAAAGAAHLAAQKGVTLEFTCGGLLSGLIDGEALARALAGLLEAAVDVSPAGSTVTLRASRAHDSGLEFELIDGGPAEEGGDHRSARRPALELARRIVNGHGGDVSAAIRDGRYCLNIWLPGRVALHVGQRR